MIITDSKSHHKLQPLWRRPKKIVEAKSNLVLAVENTANQYRQVVHVQRMSPYPVTHLRKQALQKDIEITQLTMTTDTSG